MSREIFKEKDQTISLVLTRAAAYAEKTPYELWQQEA